jgi:two-component system chemotaxis response regulator CheY
MPSETILVVDDDPICRTLSRLVLTQSGFTIHTASDGMEALELLESLRPDLILSDIQMPNMDGFELARRTRQIARFRGIPMVAMSALTDPQTEQRAFAAGYSAFLPKPVSGPALAGFIRRHLEARFAPCA